LENTTQTNYKRIAIRLILKLDDNTELSKSENQDEKKRKKIEAIIERRYKNEIGHWMVVLKIMEKNLPKNKFRRFVNLKPLINKSAKMVTEVKDFLDFTDYLIERRNVSDDMELGLLATLHTKFQKVIELEFKRILETNINIL